ncbi:MAG: hypothetical protein WCC52_09370 [Nitrosotalea sp.]
MQKAEKKRPVIDANETRTDELKALDTPKQAIRSELKKIRAENPHMYKTLSRDKFD